MVEVEDAWLKTGASKPDLAKDGFQKTNLKLRELGRI
jgi:hypothetical protein